MSEKRTYMTLGVVAAVMFAIIIPQAYALHKGDFSDDTCDPGDHCAQDDKNNPTSPGTGAGTKDTPPNNPYAEFPRPSCEGGPADNPSANLPAQCY